MTDKSVDLKSLKELIHEFNAFQKNVTKIDKTTDELVYSLSVIGEKLLQELRSKQLNYSEQIKNADLKKMSLFKKLKMYENDIDKSFQDEIIRELEEYSRIRRHCSAQLARIEKVIGNFQNISSNNH